MLVAVGQAAEVMAGGVQEAAATVEEAEVAVAVEAEDMAVVDWASAWLEEAGMVKVVGREAAEFLEKEAGPVEEKREGMSSLGARATRRP